MTDRFELDVNGGRAAVEADPLATLDEILRDELGFRSVRSPCGVGVCGACTVLVAGRPVKACLQAIGLVGDAPITTVEGLAPDDPVIAAFAARNAFQCGFCIPGFVTTVHGLLLQGDVDPTLEDVRDGLAGNLCRCGSYGPILEAVADVLARRGGDGAGAPTGAPTGTPREGDA